MEPSPFNLAYGLREHEVIRRVPPPFIDQRMDFYRTTASPSQVSSIPRGPDAMTIWWQDGRPRHHGCFFGIGRDGGRGYGIKSLIEQFLRIYPQDVEGNLELLRMTMPGDFVIKPDADFEQYRLALQNILSQAAGGPVTLTPREIEQPAIVFEGIWQARPQSHGPLIISARKDDPYTGGGGGTGTIGEFAGWVGRWIKKSVIVDAVGAPAKISWQYHSPRTGDVEMQQQAHDPALVCSHIQEQTGLTWKEEIRSVRRLFVEHAR